MESEKQTVGWGLFRRRLVLLPTWKGWLFLLVGFAMAGMFVGKRLHPFLALTDSRPGGVLVVEGWAPDDSLRLAVVEFTNHHYHALCVTGVKVDFGGLLQNYSSYAEVGAASLIAMGVDSNKVHAITAPDVRVDRTFASALALAKWFHAQPNPPGQVNLMTEGPHARRSRLLFQEALGKQAEVGVIAAPPLGYDPKRWWRYSSGVRVVIGELIAYGYAKFFFKAEVGTDQPKERSG